MLKPILLSLTMLFGVTIIGCAPVPQLQSPPTIITTPAPQTPPPQIQIVPVPQPYYVNPPRYYGPYYSRPVPTPKQPKPQPQPKTGKGFSFGIQW
jgi:hypothetical protein